MADNSQTQAQIPAEFKKIIIDMTKDILLSFPEQEQHLQKDLKNLLNEVDADQALGSVFEHCNTVYPAKFFDILYQNNTIFEKDDSEFLPGIHFNHLWKENISDKTRETIWKYLQLVLFTIVSGISDGNSFGDTAKLFEAINETEFKSKLEETISQMQTLFGEEKAAPGADKEREADGSEATDDEEKKGINLDDLPNPAEIHEHVSNMMNGKLGKLAREIAEETAADLNINSENPESINDVFKRLIHNPTKLLSLVKNVGSKLDEKIKAGDMKESELLEEASELMKKMKNMPGMGDIQSMLSKMGMNMGKGSGKVNVDAMQSNLNQKLKESKNRERLLKKLYEKKNAQAQQVQAQQVQAQQVQAQQQAQAAAQQQAVENLVFSKGEKIERSSREQPQGAQATATATASASASAGEKKKKKNKK
jgi:hypothetical protein